MREIFTKFLDGVREEGKINMFGAVPLLMQKFYLSKKEARDILKEWMDMQIAKN